MGTLVSERCWARTKELGLARGRQAESCIVPLISSCSSPKEPWMVAQQNPRWKEKHTQWKQKSGWGLPRGGSHVWRGAFSAMQGVSSGLSFCSLRALAETGSAWEEVILGCWYFSPLKIQGTGVRASSLASYYFHVASRYVSTAQSPAFSRSLTEVIPHNIIHAIVRQHFSFLKPLLLFTISIRPRGKWKGFPLRPVVTPPMPVLLNVFLHASSLCLLLEQIW